MRSVHQNCTFRSHINQDLFSVITTNGKSAACARLLTHHIQFVRGDAATIFKCELGECVMYTGLHNQNYISETPYTSHTVIYIGQHIHLNMGCIFGEFLSG